MNVMRRRFAHVILFALCFGGAIVWACGGEIETKFGGPNALSKEKAPPDPNKLGPGGVDGSLGDASPLNCTPIDGGTCLIKWSTDLVPLMKDDGGWGCGKGGSCHGGAASPPINANNPTEAYGQLRTYTGIRNQAYINPCSKDPNASTFTCNLTGAPNTCGSLMPKGIATVATDMQKLDTWIKCGAPNN